MHRLTHYLIWFGCFDHVETGTNNMFGWIQTTPFEVSEYFNLKLKNVKEHISFWFVVITICQEKLKKSTETEKASFRRS